MRFKLTRVTSRYLLLNSLILLAFSKSFAQAPSNDECSGAIVLSVNPDNSCTSLYSGNTGYPTQSFSACTASGYDARDVWFSFTATATSHRVTVAPISYDNYAFQVYSGNCGSLVSLACVNTGLSNEPDVALFSNLIAGNVYYIRVYDYYGGGSVSRQFSVCISTTPSIVNNDDCSGALTVTPSANANPGNYVIVNNTGATQSMASCFGTAEDDIWFKFTATSNRHKIITQTNNDINPVLEIFSGSCGSLTSLTCRYLNNGSPYGSIDADLTNLVAGTTYYYRIYGTSANNIRTNISTNITTLQAALPVKLFDFYVHSTTSKSMLSWKTVMEINNLGFEVQYSKDGNHFDSVGFIASKAMSGNSTNELTYQYHHELSATVTGKIYYRLKQIDIDNNYEYSKIISTSIPRSKISIYPNPVSDHVFLNLNNSNEYSFTVIDYSGRIFKSGLLKTNSINLSELPPGVYVLALKAKNDLINFKFVKR